MSNKINEIGIFLERKFGLWSVAFGVGLVLLGLAMLYVKPHFQLAFHGLQFGLLSNDPFDFSQANPLRYRILPSLLGYLTFLRGNRFVLLPLIFAVAFLSVIYGSFRRKGFQPMEAVLTAGLIAFSSSVLIQLIAPGYTDSVFYFFIFLSFHFVRKPFVSGLFFALALLTHESSLFMLPPLLVYALYLHPGEWAKLGKYALILAVAVVPLLLYRIWVSQHVQVEYDLSYYFSTKNIAFTRDRVLPRLPVGLFFVFKLLWLIPIFAFVLSLLKREFLFAFLLLTLLICDVAQLLIAFDVTRMLGLGFPILLLSAEKLRTYWPGKQWLTIVGILLLINLMIPQHFMTVDGLVPMPPIFLK